MADQKRDYDAELFNVMSALAETEWEMTDKEVIEDARVRGEDIEKEAELVKDIFRRALKEHRQAPLREAQQKYKDRVASMFRDEISLPQSADGRRELLDAFFASRPELGSALLTAQHREFSELTDSDVEDFLRQLKELGALDNE
jgi:hypothetical protein